MNEVRRKSLLRKIDDNWLAMAADLLGIEAENKKKDVLLEEILGSRDENPATLLFLLHQGIVSLMLNLFGDSIGKDITPDEINAIRKKLFAELKTVKDEDYILEHPNHSLISSAAFAEFLADAKLIPELILEWSDDFNDVMSTVLISHELWNLIGYYGIIPPEDLLRLHAASHGEPEALPFDILGMAQGYIELNLSDEIFLEEIDGQDYFLTEYKGVDAEEILEDLKDFDEDYKVVEMDQLIEMLHGVAPQEIMLLIDYIVRVFHTTEEVEAMMGDTDFLQSLVISLKGRSAHFVPDFLHEQMGWSWSVGDEEVRELIFQELLEMMPRFHLKGHSEAELSGLLDEDLEDEGEEPMEEDFFDELSLRRRRQGGDDDKFLN